MEVKLMKTGVARPDSDCGVGHVQWKKIDCIFFFLLVIYNSRVGATSSFSTCSGNTSANSFQRLFSRAQAFRHLGAMLGAEIHNPTLPSFKHNLVQKYANTRPGLPKHFCLKLRKSAQRRCVISTPLPAPVSVESLLVLV